MLYNMYIIYYFVSWLYISMNEKIATHHDTITSISSHIDISSEAFKQRVISILESWKNDEYIEETTWSQTDKKVRYIYLHNEKKITIPEAIWLIQDGIKDPELQTLPGQNDLREILQQFATYLQMK